MERSSEKAQAASNRRFLWLGLAIVIAIIAYSGFWFYLARQLESRSEFLLSDLASRNVEAQCDAMEVRGYPFRLGVFCNSVSADDRLNGASLSAGEFRSAAQIYRPNHIVSELDGPATLSGNGMAADLNWQVLSASTVFSLSGLSRASVQSSDLTAEFRQAAQTDTLGLAAGTSEVHVRRNEADLDAAVRLEAAKLTSGSGSFSLPAFDLQGNVTLADRAWMLGGQQQADNPWHNLSASLNGMSATLDGGAVLEASGPFSIDGDGLLTAKFNLEVSGREAWQDILTEAFPDAADTIANAISLLGGIGRAQDSLTLPININRGRIMIGFIPLGRLPPV